MGQLSRTKGHSYEREIANLFKEFFPEAKRNLTETQTGGQGIDLVNTGEFKVQCKRGRKYAPLTKIKEVNWSEPHIPLLITKGDNEKSMVGLYLEDFKKLLKAYLENYG